MCRQCFRKQPHVKAVELASSKVSCANYRQNNKEKVASIRKDWVLANKEYVAAYQKQYRKEHKERKRELENGYYENNLNHKIAMRLRNRLNQALNGETKYCSAVDDLGCTVEELKLYLESKFKPGMGWDNWTTDGWHIDHRKPLAAFDLADPAQQLEACHYSNLQPLWAEENLSKGDNYVN